ncbi:hypothetical protein M8J76_000876 [Diaphorina citri]|nr:hypothetical protein M8J76_000876 [Diaphorina citri]
MINTSIPARIHAAQQVIIPHLADANAAHNDILLGRLRRAIDLDLCIEGSRSSVQLPRPTNLTILHPVPKVVGIADLLDGIPFPVNFVTAMVMELSGPSMQLTERTPATIAKQLGMLYNKSSIIPDVLGLNPKSSMNEQFATIVTALMLPGYVELDIGFDSRDVRLFEACVVKALLAYSPDGITSHVSRRTAMDVEDIIFDALVHNRQVIGGIINRDRLPFSRNLAVIGVVTAAQLVTLRPTPQSGGWGDAGVRPLADDAMAAMYPECPRRPIYYGADVNHEDDVVAAVRLIKVTPLVLVLESIIHTCASKSQRDALSDLFRHYIFWIRHRGI